MPVEAGLFEAKMRLRSFGDRLEEEVLYHLISAKSTESNELTGGGMSSPVESMGMSSYASKFMVNLLVNSSEMLLLLSSSRVELCRGEFDSVVWLLLFGEINKGSNNTGRVVPQSGIVEPGENFRNQGSSDARPLAVWIDRPKPFWWCPIMISSVVSNYDFIGLSRRKAQSSPPPPPTKRIVYRESVELPYWQQNWFIAFLFTMALAFLGLAIYLFLFIGGGFDFYFDHYGFTSSSSSSSSSSSPSPASAASTDQTVHKQITYGSVLKLMHERTKFRLHSHDVPYGSGSGQQSVTAFPNVDDVNSYWIVRPIPDSSPKQGDVITTGTLIRLQHMKTRKWLHSHLHASPISGNLEVSCFGGEQESDTGDYWRLMIEGSGTTWKLDERVRLHHVDTGGYLHSHDKKYQRIAGGQQEVCGVREKNRDNVWLAAEGVYLPVTESK
ncbi:hypothetical protein ACFE04_016967 [Oxalis oulophora]